MHLGPHSHSDDCGHHHGPTDLTLAFGLAVVLNILLVVGEAVGGFIAGSVALLADAGHNLGDVVGLILAWGAHWLRNKPNSGRWTYGLRSFTTLAASINGILLVCTVIGIGIESVRRLYMPTDISEIPVLVVAFTAALINFATARLLAGQNHDLNVRGAYLHMLADAAVSMAVVVGAIVIMLSGWQWIDPAISIGICIALGIGTWGLLKESTSLLMNAAPRHIEIEKLKQWLASYPEIDSVTDLHVWSVSTTDVLLTARIHCPTSEDCTDTLLNELHFQLAEKFQIAHATIEIRNETSEATSCPLEFNE